MAEKKRREREIGLFYHGLLAAIPFPPKTQEALEEILPQSFFFVNFFE